jgi:hypothetical protein
VTVPVTSRLVAMPSKTTRTGVCLVRIQTQQRGVLITLRTNDDVEQVSTERVQVVTDIDAAVAAVRAFLLTFTAGSVGGGPGTSG